MPFQMKGVLSATTHILNTLNRLQLLQALLQKDPTLTPVSIPQDVIDRITSHTSLVLVGHSLGAGIAALLSLCLHAQFPNRCYAYDPPGQTLSPKLSEFVAPFVTTLVMGNDCIPRLSGYGYILFQDNIVSALCCCSCSKMELIGRLITGRGETIRNLFYNSIDDAPREKQDFLRQWLRHVIANALSHIRANLSFVSPQRSANFRGESSTSSSMAILFVWSTPRRTTFSISERAGTPSPTTSSTL